MNKILYIGLSAISALILSSCKNELDVLAPGEESVSVYGVINPNERTQNIRINKVYLTEGDALAAGQDNATINYGPGELRVSLQRYVNGNLSSAISGSPAVNEIVLTETVVTTAAGEFNAGQRIWQTDKKLFNSGEYKLTIKNVGNGKEFTATTQMVDSVKSYGGMPFIATTASNPPSHYPVHCGVGVAGYIWGTMPGAHTQQIAYIDYHVLTGTPKIKFKSVANAKSYKVIMRFHYIDSLTDGTAYRRYVDMNFPSQTSSTLVGGQEMEVSFSAPDFYTNLASQIPRQTVGTIKLRTAHYMQYIIYACGDDMNTFLQVNQPSNTIAQDKPNYTNINGGVGIFGAISKSSVSKELWSEFIDEISNNPTTSSLQFIKRYAIICP
jgi:hypothetical protein